MTSTSIDVIISYPPVDNGAIDHMLLEVRHQISGECVRLVMFSRISVSNQIASFIGPTVG